MFKFLCIPVRDGSGPLLPPPSKIHPGSLPSWASFPSPTYFLPFCLLSVHISIFSRPPPAASGPSSSVRRKYSSLRMTADQCPLLVSCPAAHNAGLHPPRPVRLVVLGLGVGGGTKETVPPHDGMESLDAPAGDARVSVLSSTLEFSLRLLR